MKANIIFLTLLFIISCKSEEPQFNYQEVVSVAHIKNYLPHNYFESPTLIYKNEEGEEKQLFINFEENIVERNIADQSYSAEEIIINIFESESSNFRININASSYFVEENKITSDLFASLMLFNPTGSTVNNIAFNENGPIVSHFDDFHSNLVLLGRKFSDVFVAIGKDWDVQYDAYSELNINSEVGVVAFRDKNNDLWVFDRFE